MAKRTLCVRLWLAAVCVSLASRGTVAQRIVATNSTNSDSPGTNDTSMTISRNQDMVPLAPVLPLTDSAANEVPPTGLSGEIVDVNPNNQLGVDSGAVALISCDSDDYPGNIDQTEVFRNVVDRNVTAVLFYSNEADYCQLDGGGDLSAHKWVFSMKSRNDTTNVLSAIADSRAPLWVTIGGPEVQQGRSGAGNGPPDDNRNEAQGPLGPNPSTAVAMIILYTITGVITALFLVIIITGAIRAHRHPERYGPRAMTGRPRQSRARGIGRAILEGIPIVKFGERDEEVKSADVEMGATTTTQLVAPNNNASTENRSAPVATNSDGAPAEDGIAAAGGTVSSNPPSENDTQGCSICTEDFERGQDQRVLPCDHRFHPECIDPWLLNVSGTCPLCRVDLRPQQSRTSQDVDEHGNPIRRESADGELGDLPPPVAERSSVRRSLMIGILGIRGQPDRMTREERVEALRRYHQQQAARRRRDTGSSEGDFGSGEADDRTVRRRLRTLLGIRTRRTGQDRSVAEEGDDAADVTTSDATVERR